jgi:serine kinase of HPr protein (carbohydrate metabolism regulator)
VAEAPASVHASAVLVGARAVLIRGPAGSGKSRLALDLIQAAQAGKLTFARLVADDRVVLTPAHGRLLARPPEALAGLIEVRGLGIRRLDHEGVAVVGLVVDLAVSGAPRLPQAQDREVEVAGITLPRLAIAVGAEALPSVLAFHLTKIGGSAGGPEV